MIQGAGSNVGKSVLVAGLARLYARRGLKVRPFKPQNMSNNAAVTADGGEIGRAQALQARACGVEPSIHMNPVLLKPETDTGAQVIVQGQRLATVRARDYANLKPQLLDRALDSFARVSEQADLVIVEGAGSPAETNLRQGDIANMGFAQAANLPVILAGDIDRGGVIAQLVGTHAVLDDRDRARIKGFLVNKFRGDPTLFDAGMADIARRTGWAALGVVPWFPRASGLPAEDIMDLPSRTSGKFRIAVPRLPRIANFDDLDPLLAEPRIGLTIVEQGRPLPGDADLVIIPGSKATIADLDAFRENGWDIDLHAHIRRGGQVLGICGGYQMLGRVIHDPDGIEGRAGSYPGLGHLDVETRMDAEKTLTRVDGTAPQWNVPLEGYEIHIGTTTGPDAANGWLIIGGKVQGASSMDGQVRGCYVHGLFAGDAFRAAYLKRLGVNSDGQGYWRGVDAILDDLADHLQASLDMPAVDAIWSGQL